MCGKEGCWSTRYTQEEHNKSKKKFNSQINQFILEYKREKEKEFPDELIETLIIDFDLDV